MVKIPYSKMELQIASFDLMSRLEKDTEIREKFEIVAKALVIEPGTKLKCVAEYHGIQLELLVNSPNMNNLVDAWEENRAKHIVSKFEEIGFDVKESWILLSFLTDSSDIFD